MPSYWTRFPHFVHNAKAPIKQEFRRLALLNNWIGKDGKQTKMFQKELGKCFRSEFHKHYGHDASSLPGWQSLCKEVRLENIPQSVAGCKSALKGKVWVNIVALVDRRRTGGEVERHKSEKALREYTKETDKIFPKEAA